MKNLLLFTAATLAIGPLFRGSRVSFRLGR
jgi:hypothetical protein